MAPQIKAPTTLHPSPPPACLTLDIVHVLEAVAADLLQLLDSSVLGKLLHQLDDALWEGDRAQRGTGRSAASGSFFTPQLDDALLLKAEAREQRARVSVCRCCWNGCKSPCPSPPTGGRRLQSPRHPGARLTLHSLTQPPSLHSPFMQVHVPSLIPPSPPPPSLHSTHLVQVPPLQPAVVGHRLLQLMIHGRAQGTRSILLDAQALGARALRLCGDKCEGKCGITTEPRTSEWGTNGLHTGLTAFIRGRGQGRNRSDECIRPPLPTFTEMPFTHPFPHKRYTPFSTLFRLP